MENPTPSVLKIVTMLQTSMEQSDRLSKFFPPFSPERTTLNSYSSGCQSRIRNLKTRADSAYIEACVAFMTEASKLHGTAMAELQKHEAQKTEALNEISTAVARFKELTNQKVSVHTLNNPQQDGGVLTEIG